MKKIIASVSLLVCFVLAWAIVERTEKMTVVKTDGSTVEFNVGDIDRVDFEVIENKYALIVEPAQGNPLKLEAIPAVFRMEPEAEGAPYSFGISTVEAADPAAARQGDYAIELKVGQTKMNISDVDLAGGAASGVTVILYSYKDGEVDNIWEVQDQGKLSTAVNTKTKQITIALEATYADGTKVSLEYEGKVINVDDLNGLNPPFEYKNQGQYFNPDQVPYGMFNVTGMTYTANVEKRGVKGDQFEFELSNGKTCWFILDSKYFNQTFDFATAGAGECYFYYDNIQLVSKGTPYMNQGTEGTINVVKNSDGSFVINAKVTNKYIPSWGGSVGGTPEYVIFNYTSGAVAPDPEPEPEPVVLVDQMMITDSQGNAGSPLNIVKMEHKTGMGIPYNTDIKADRFDFYTGIENEPACYIILKPEFIGQTVDIASAEAQSFYFKYGATEISASNLSWLSGNIGKEGSISIVLNANGSYTINLDIAYKTSGNPDAKGRFNLNYTSPATKPEPEPEPVVTYKNQGQYFNVSGEGTGVFTVEDVKYTAGASYRNVEGHRFDFTLSNGTECYFLITDKYIGKTFDFADVKEANQVYFKYGNITLMSQKSIMFEGNEGKITVIKKDDDTFTIDIDVTNKYLSWGSQAGTPERVVINFSNATEVNPEPTPEIKNEGQFFDMNGEGETPFTIESVKYTPGASYRNVTGSRFDFTLSNGKTCYFLIDDKYINSTFDFAEVKEANQIYFVYDRIMLLSQKSLMNEGILGTVKVTKNDDGTFVIEVDVTNKYLSWGSEAGTPERVVLTFKGAATE